jgi:hypothetical protein
MRCMPYISYISREHSLRIPAGRNPPRSRDA